MAKESKRPVRGQRTATNKKHSDEKEDMALIKKMVKPSDLKKSKKK